MSKQEISKRAHSKQVTERNNVTKNVAAKEDLAKNVHSKHQSSGQLIAENSILRQRISGSDNAKGEYSLKQLDKALQVYIRNIGPKDLDSAQKAKISFTGLLSNKLLLVMLIRKGIPYSIFTLIQNITPFSLNDWANYLDISTKSLSRYQQQDKPFKPGLTEKIIELAEVTNLGIAVFGNNEKFRVWLETPNYALGNLKPFDLLRDSYGKEMIIGELTRIEHGILA